MTLLNIKERSVVVSGSTTSFWEYGDSSSPIQLVLIHGFRGDHHGLEPFAAMLGPDVHLIIPDLPGFGKSEAFKTPATIDQYSSWLIGFWRELHLKPNTVILGHSFGSIVVAAALSAGLPSKKAILVNPIAANALKGPRGFMTKLAVLYYRMAAALPERMGYALLKNRAIVRIMSVTMAKTGDKKLRKWIHNQHDQYFSIFASRNSVLEAFQTSVSHDVSEYSAAISQEVLMLAAEKDDITALPQQYALAKKLTRSQIEVIPSVGHLVHYEAPEAAAKHIRSFIAMDTK